MEDKRAHLSKLVNEFIDNGDNSLKPTIEGLIQELKLETGNKTPLDKSFFAKLRERFT